ncbi:MAG: hypothetical protein AAB697_03295 [Patescibacteria group bacterium]
MNSKPRSVVQDWISKLPLREQGTLLTSIRGCDLVPKQPYDSLARQLTAYLRFLVLNPADEREIGIKGAFFQREVPNLSKYKTSELEHLPMHWYSHLMHAFEVCGYRHPRSDYRKSTYNIYFVMCHGLHLSVETKERMITRLSEDRIAKGNVVS